MIEYEEGKKDEIPKNTRLLLTSGGDYWVGAFDGNKFTAERPLDKYRVVNQWLKLP